MKRETRSIFLSYIFLLTILLNPVYNPVYNSFRAFSRFQNSIFNPNWMFLAPKACVEVPKAGLSYRPLVGPGSLG